MAEQIVSDLLMKFVDLNGQAIVGDARTVLPDKKNAMLKGFDQQHMFEVQSFSFKTGLGGEDLDKKEDQQKKDADKTTSTVNHHAEVINNMAGAVNSLAEQHNELAGLINAISDALKHVSTTMRTAHPSARSSATTVKTADASAKGVDGAAKTMKTSSSQGFVKFRTGKMTEKTRYPVDMKPIEFERAIDRTSLVLMHHCIKRIPFKGATLIKRKAAGGPASGEVFLRFDFNTVLIKSVNWDDGTPVKETVEFICRAVTIHYKPQLPDGTLGAAIQAFWKASDSSSIQPENLNSSQ